MIVHVLDKIFFESDTVVRKKSYKEGEAVFCQGDPARNIYALKKGQVVLERPTIEGKSIIMHTAGAGESFAEASLFSDMYHCNAIATLPSVVHCYPKTKILAILQADPIKSLKFTALLSSQVRNLRTRLELRNILSARERIMQYLLLAAEPDTREVFLATSYKEIAREVGLAHETLYRILAELEKDGIIEREKKKIKIV